ncbi:DUF262 domain-containing protein [Qipengyuania sp. XHP0207]|uniref:DUF262 domain-containing protein n=1 Tax=Qipengyuania sp. XHP0207 TaxID=3038078 RepID=UPI00241F4244|nr:DUF262 domain-containing protein [Qipengyuania sp. XHP0207]MDG5747561.1 DUF262 domain-containing protein [Qipengyuania sp. XHP0207]
MSFDTTKTNLKDLLGEVHSGKLQLPDFQRDYVWDEDGVCSLLASIAKGFPVGALLTLERGGSVEFKPRGLRGTPFENKPEEECPSPEMLLLDGQQRMTSLYQSVFSEKPAEVRTAKGKKVRRFFYLDIEKAMQGGAEFEEAIITIPDDRIMKGAFGKAEGVDVSTSELEYANLMFPLNQALNPTQWIFDCVAYWKGRDQDRMQELFAFQKDILERIQSYAMPVIRLDKSNSREAVCTVFEKVNVGGKKLDAFELVTAIYAADRFNLREDWFGDPKAGTKGRLELMRGDTPSKGLFQDIANTDFLQACTVLYTMDEQEKAITEGKTGKAIPAISCRREIMLGLPLEAYRTHADGVQAGFVEAAKFLNGEKIVWGRDLPYPPQMVALAAFFARYGSKLSAPQQEKLRNWYWSGVLGEYYGSATETKIARDVPQLIRWMEDGEEPRTVWDTYFQIDRLDSLRMRLSAAYKGLHALLMREGCRDFISGKPVDLMTVNSDPLDIHHIFPRKWCDDRGIDPNLYNSIVNKTALSAGSNREIGGSAPSAYLTRIEQKYRFEPDQLDAILRTHLIDPDALRANDFENFYKARKEALAKLAQSAQGKAVVTDSDEEAGLPDPEMREAETLENMIEEDVSTNQLTGAVA